MRLYRKNELTIKIQNNMGRGFQEILFYAKSTRQVALEPTGLLGPVTVDFMKI